MNNVFYEADSFDLIPFDKRFVQPKFKQSGVKTNYITWFSNQEVNQHNSHGLFPQSEKEFNSYFNKISNNEVLVLAIIAKRTESLDAEELRRENPKGKVHIGNISLQSIDWINRSAEFAIVLGEKEYWGKGYATAAAKLLFHHGFHKLNLHRIWSGTSETNTGMIKVFKKLGMKHEGTFRQATYIMGDYRNIVEYGILKNDFSKKYKKR